MDSPYRSVSFDRAADVYDATRALPPGVAAALTDALVRELRRAGADCVLEAGVGTGRISRPLAERGLRVCGLDISRRMIERLRDQLTSRHTPPDLLLGDAARLPLADASFPAALSFHVLHLVADWQGAIDEARRVLRPGGVFIYYLRRDEFARWKDSADKWDAMLAERGFERRRRPSTEEIGDRLRGLGGACRIEQAATEEERTTPREMLEITRNRVHSWTWEIPDDIWDDCFREYETWAADHLGPMDEPRIDTIVHELHVWRFGGQPRAAV